MCIGVHCFVCFLIWCFISNHILLLLLFFIQNSDIYPIYGPKSIICAYFAHIFKIDDPATSVSILKLKLKTYLLNKQLLEDKGVSKGSDGGGRSPLGKFDAPQGYQNNDFHLKIRAVFSLMSSEKCHITIFARPLATAMKFYYRRATADLFPSSHKIQLTNISLIRNKRSRQLSVH